MSQGAKVQNGNDHLFIYGERTAKHNSVNHVSESFGYRVALDREYFKGKKVIIFDDVITSGATAQEFASQLAECGAKVMGAMFLARTKECITNKNIMMIRQIITTFAWRKDLNTEPTTTAWTPSATWNFYRL